MTDTTHKLLQELIDAQKELSGLVSIFLKRDSLQSTLINEMASVGIQPKRIAELLDTTSNTVSVTLAKSKKTKK